jgi:hypothetical protein
MNNTKTNIVVPVIRRPPVTISRATISWIVVPRTATQEADCLSHLYLIPSMTDLPILQKTYDLIRWYIPIINRLPRSHKLGLGDRLTQHLYDLLEGLIIARYQSDKLTQLTVLNTKLELLRYHSRLLLDFELVSVQRYEYAAKLINTIGQDLGGWIKQQQRSES